MDTLRSFSKEKIGKYMKLNTEHYKVPRLRMSGVIPPIQLCVLMHLTMTNLPSSFVTLYLLTYNICSAKL
jgi:hypothetical protein